MRKKLMDLFAALSMMIAGAGVSFAPIEVQAQSYRSDRGSAVGRRYDAPRRGYRGYRGGRNVRGFRGPGYRASRGYRGARGYRSYRDDRRGRAYRNFRGNDRNRFDGRRDRR